MTTTPRRVVVSIRWDSGEQRWEARFPDGFQGCLVRGRKVDLPPLRCETQQPLVRRLARYLRHCWREARALGQLRVFCKNGRVQHERTYGRDPRRFPG